MDNQSKILKDYQKTLKVLWFAILSSCFVFLGITVSGIVSSDFKFYSEDLYVYILLSIGAVVTSMFLFKRLISFKDSYSKISIDGNENILVLMRNIEDPSEDDKKTFIFVYKVLQKYAVVWALNDSIAILGVSATVIGMPAEYFFGFFAVSLLLMLLSFPKLDVQDLST